MGSAPSRAAAELAAKKRAKEHADAKAEVRRRRADAPWLEWVLEEFARYLYGLGVVAILIFVPLQMADSWLPSGGPPAVDPAVVAGLAVTFEIAAALLGFLAYRFLWHETGPIARAIARRTRQDPEGAATGPEAPPAAAVPPNVRALPSSPGEAEAVGPPEPATAPASARAPEEVSAADGDRARTPWFRRWGGSRRRR